MLSDDLLLSLLWVLPVGGALLVLLIPDRMTAAIKGTALSVCGLAFVLTLLTMATYLTSPAASAPLAERAEAHVLAGPSQVQPEAPEGDLVVRHEWIPAFAIQYFLGLDGINLGLLVLSGLVGLLACVASLAIDRKVKGYFSLYLLLLGTIQGAFLALDLVLFYVFFEVMLLPMYFLIALWGGEHREYAALKFLLYTLFGSVFILVAILILFFWGGDGAPPEWAPLFHGRSFDAILLARVAADSGYYGADIQPWIFGLFLVGFLVKLPSFPFHTWLPDAHVEAPTPISMILAGVLLKVGGYGLLRLAWPLAPAGAQALAPIVAGLGVFSILYGALAAMAQVDYKKLVAYSSVSHMGYVTLGLAAMAGLSVDPGAYAYGVAGALYVMLAHGITSTAMFFLVGVIYDRAHTRELDRLGGLMGPMPLYSGLGFVVLFGSMGLPGLCGFIGEVLVVIASFHYSVTLGVLAALAVVLTAGYILWTIQRVYLGRNENWKGLPDLTPRELTVLVPLVVLTIALGVAPQLVLSWANPSLEQTIRGIAGSPVRREVDRDPPAILTAASRPGQP